MSTAADLPLATHLPDLRGVRGEMLLVRTREVSLQRPVRLLHPRIPLYVAPRADGVFMIGATMIESAEPGGVSVRSAIELLSAAYALHPAFGEAEILEMSADVRPAYPDNEPRIVRARGAHLRQRLLSPRLSARAAFRGKGGGDGVASRGGGGVRLIVNGDAQDLSAANLAEALRALDYADAIVATALNGEFVPARKREATPVKDGDRIEIVAPRQGG